MIKNLAYGALAAASVAAAALVVPLVTTSSSDSTPPATCTVTLDANGGTFTVLETNVYCDASVAYSNLFGSVFNEDTVVTNYNFDLKGWTLTPDGTDFIANSDPILSNTTAYAKWERSAIQKFNLVNGEFKGSDSGENYVAKFPAAFYGTATVTETNGHSISFIAPTSGTFRISFDPQIGWDRIYAVVTIQCEDGKDAESLTFGHKNSYDTLIPVTFENDARFYQFKQGQTYAITFDFTTGMSAWDDVQAHYVFGIDLGGQCIRLDPGEYGTIVYYYKDSQFDTRFRNEGVNFSTNYPFGYLPTPTKVNDSVTFQGWYSEKKGGVKIESSTLVGTNEVYYAHWKLPTYNYYVTFDKVDPDAQGRKMTKQTFTSGVAQSLSINRYYLAEHKFMGWDTASAAANVVYTDGQTVTDIWDVPEGTCPLYAVWQETPGTNYFTVSKGVTNFTNVAISGVQTFVSGTMSTSEFLLSVTNAATLRVSLDPKAGSERAGATLSVYKQDGGSWSNVCSVTDLATTNTMYSFEANTTYRFEVTGASSSYGYVVGLGAEGRQIDYATCGVKDMTFNWTVDTPYGYWPKLTSASYGTHLGWFYDADITHTNQVDELENVSSNATIYAHWSNQPYTIVFDGNGAENPTNSYAQGFNYDIPQALARNMYNKTGYRFRGWDVDPAATNAFYADGQVVSNLCTNAGGTNRLYAVWSDPTPGTNWYYVAGTMTNFENIAVSPESPSYFVGMGDSTRFLVTRTNIAKCRVALDPQEGFPRVGATLTVECAEIPTNATETLEWESACDEVSDLSEKAVTCAFTTNRYYRFTITGVANTNGYVVSIGAKGARYIFDACGGNFADEEKATTKLKFFDWTVGTPIGYLPTLTTNKYVHGKYEWHYTPLVNETNETSLVCTTNAVVGGGDRIYAIWLDCVVVPIVFDWNNSATNVVFTNYYAQGASVDLYDEDYVRQPAVDQYGFLGWTTNQAGTLGWDLVKIDSVATNSPGCFYAQWTKEWKTSRRTNGISVDGRYGDMPSALNIPVAISPCPKSVIAIGDSAFTNALFTTLELPETLTSIGDSAFYGCSAFKKLEIPATVTSIGDSAFEDCTALVSVEFPNGDTPDEYTAIGDGGFLDGVFDEDSPSVSLGTCLFKGCTSLKTVELPLGVNEIPNECFSGCKALASFDNMPYTVVKIGEEAFAGCTHLTSVTLKEVVSTIGDRAFLKCARLRNVRFLGDQPGTVGDDVFKGTQRNVLVAYLENMCTTANEYCGGSWPELPGTWPSGGDYARTLTWLGGSYPRRKVIFNYNDKSTLYESTKKTVLYHSGRVFGLHAPKETEDGTEISWYTQPTGGRKIGNYWEVPTATEGDSAPIVVYAHSASESEEGDIEIGSRSADEYPVTGPWADGTEEAFDEFSGFYSADDDMFYYSACTFDGIVYYVDGEDSAVTGLVSFAFNDGTDDPDEGMTAPFTATITWNNGKKTSISGVADAEGHLVSSNIRWSFGEGDEAIVITKSGIYGWLADEVEGVSYRIYAARNRYAAAATANLSSAEECAAWTVVNNCVLATRGTWHVVLECYGEPEGEGAEFAYGYSTLVVSIADGGAATIKGTLGDGTAVSSSSRLIIGDGCCCLPVNIRPYSGKGGFAFMLWFTWEEDGSLKAEDATVQGLTGWDASMSSHPFTVERLKCADDDNTLTFIDDRLCTGEKTFSADLVEVTAPVKMNGRTWSVPANDNNVKLSYDYKTGVFTGSFEAAFEDVKKKAAVSGVLTDRIEEDGSDTYKGFGTAVIKGEGSCSVIIE